MATIRIGISGWTYAPWRGTFFPEDLVQHQELAYASRKVSSIEINGTFYALQTPTSYAHWYEQTPDDFVFSVKAPRFITHIKRLKGGRAPLANFFASGVLSLKQKLGPILWQLPPSLPFDPGPLGEFLGSLPRSTAEAAELARHHDARIKKAWAKPERDRPLRHALEVRHFSFKTPEFIALLRKHKIALVVADTAGKWPLMEDVTADFIYVRLHGDAELYVSGYTDAALASWAKKMRAWSLGKSPPDAALSGSSAAPRARGRDVYVYFDNDVKTHAPYDAMNLAHRLKLGPKPGSMLGEPTKAPPARTRWPGFKKSASRTGRKRLPEPAAI